MSTAAIRLSVLLALVGCWAGSSQAQDTLCRVTPDDPDGDCIIGEARVDYPTLLARPPTSFNCDEYEYPGLYADVEADCQLFHFCPPRGLGRSANGEDRPAAFLCTPGSLFNQQYGVCDHWFNVVCERAPQYYGLNKLLYEKSLTGDWLVGDSAGTSA
ncbi:uncharacterized protein LOC122380717 [Amphibalanus amphitrite]|uniref:uncharacterized protein LOC122380717 n=1 Tax=Amphibalanus amphitrite TaxID=1232801 RepID=UPI001C910C74|nr:uncharacterized protein LOC122380717 [Amphibalanus amphitrite]